MKVLGAIIAGGASTRFGSDKAAALLQGRPLLDHVIAGMKSRFDALVIVGRDWPGLLQVEDKPASGLGPLGGLCGALDYAQNHGFDAVLSTGCDVLPVAAGLEIGQVVDGHYLMGMWPTKLAKPLLAHLKSGSNLSMRHWIDSCGMQLVKADQIYYNFNTPDALASYELALGTAA